MAVYKRPGSSVWQCEFEFKGKRIRESTGETSKTAAQAWEVKRRAEVREDHELARAGRGRMGLFEAAHAWLEATEATHRNHKHDVSRVRKLFGSELVKDGPEWVERHNARFGLPKDLGVHDLTQAHLVALKKARVAEGNSAATINREMSLVQSILGYVQASGTVMPATPIVWSQRHNKAASLKAPEGRGKLRWLRVHEEEKLLESLRAAAFQAPKDRSALDAWHLSMLLLDSGARYNEAATLRWSQVNFDEGTIDLFRSKVQNESLLKLPARSRAMLAERQTILAPHRLSYVFPQLSGKAWSGEDVPRGHATGSIQRHMDDCGLNDDPTQDRATPHTFRDTFASRLVQAGVPLLTVQHLLGHADASMTQKYAHLCPDAAGAQAAAVLDRLHGNKPPQGDDLIATPHKSPRGSVPHTKRLTLVA
ncbi:site-specific integrase [Rhizobacter sp. Root1221]|uniref:tyrosine-type recombinase/integrase n=1 Tax=Rhizobacter sp. Root1221 TaxID=1736433 RepID=UPI0006F3166F|nr:site-specific integrase [Rhizobacter sp. Root1221]KQV99943.1 hypothetical protein ASC87_19780 [Rhizobacter sp. Root1221]